MAIPLPERPGQQVGRAFDSIGSILDKAREHALEQWKLKEMVKQHQEEMKLRQQAEGRASELFPLQKHAAKLANDKATRESNPNYEAEKIMNGLKYFESMRNGRGKAQEAPAEPTSNPSLYGEGHGMMGRQPNFQGQQKDILGLERPGNIDLNSRPTVMNPDGTISTVDSMGINVDGKEVLIPKVSEDGRHMTDQEAIQEYKNTGKHLGVFDTPENAKQYAESLHLQQQQQYGDKQENPQVSQSNNNDNIIAMAQAAFLKKHHIGGEALHGPARDASDLQKLKKESGENSEVYKNAKAAYDAQLDAKKDLRDLRARTKAGLKVGEKEFFDEKTGVPLGKEIPLTVKERESEEGNILFNELYPYVYKGAAPFSGEGSINRLQQAAANYKTDPKARKLFDDFLLSEKMLGATTVNESSTLKAGRTNRTYQMLKETLDAQDVPRLVKKYIKEYNIPASAQLHASMRYQKLLSEARNKSRHGTPATQKLYYDPEMQAKHEQSINNEEQASGDTDVIVIDPNGKRFKTTEANAAHLPEGWKHG